MKNGECDSDHIESLENAFNLIQRVNEEIAIKKLNKVNLSKITLLQERLVNYEVPFLLFYFLPIYSIIK